MAWIQSHQELRYHYKTKRLARELKVSVPAAIGHLHCLWWWAIDFAPDGDLSKLDDYEIADAIGYEGDDESRAKTALVSAGFLDSNDDGTLKIHDWFDYSGKLGDVRADAREKNRERQAKHRAKKKAEAGTSRDSHTSSHVTAANSHVTVTNGHAEVTNCHENAVQTEPKDGHSTEQAAEEQDEALQDTFNGLQVKQDQTEQAEETKTADFPQKITDMSHVTVTPCHTLSSHDVTPCNAPRVEYSRVEYSRVEDSIEDYSTFLPSKDWDACGYDEDRYGSKKYGICEYVDSD